MKSSAPRAGCGRRTGSLTWPELLITKVDIDFYFISSNKSA